MENSVNDIAKQARQGSIAAIIQLLNEILAESGVRTRAVLSDGMLQLLCEAPQANQLEQTSLVQRIRRILESISPRNIKRVNINSRIVREQQLLWLEEIRRDPEGQLLWSEEITLKKQNLFKQIIEDWKLKSIQARGKQSFPKFVKSDKKSKNQQFWLGLAGGASLLLLFLVGGGFLFNWLQIQWTGDAENVGETSTETYKTTSSGKITSQANPDASSSSNQPDPFVGAVRLAEEAALGGETAKTSAEWLGLATKWQQASEYMEQVPEDDQRYETAQNRILLYRQNSQYAQQEADKRLAE